MAASQGRTQRSGSHSHAASLEPEPEPPRDPYDGFVSCYPLLVGALMTRRPAKARLDAVFATTLCAMKWCQCRIRSLS